MPSTALKTFITSYQWAWSAALPLLRRHHRVGPGYDQRLIKRDPLPQVDLWVQSASAGEAYLAGLLNTHLRPRGPLRVLFTTNTLQGFDILKRTIGNPDPDTPPPAGGPGRITPFVRYFPFDQPRIMARAAAQARPALAILLETELWPAMMYHLNRAGCPIMLINGRLTAKSLRPYRALNTLWQQLAPDRIEAISREDAQRFREIFPHTPVGVMPNMKFDRIPPATHQKTPNPVLERILPASAPLVVLGSVREPEERQVAAMAVKIRARRPDALIALFPRHMHRLAAWAERLNNSGLPWTYRSQMTRAPSQGRVILWDTFGELSAVYHRARAVFVGGSLVPLGGQNFLEPLTCGVMPVIGPHWDNFKWVGATLFHQGLVRQAAHGAAAAQQLLKDLDTPVPRPVVTDKVMAFIRRHQGGSRFAAGLIEEFFNHDDRYWD